MEKIYHANVKQNKAGMAMSTLNIKCQMNSRKSPGIKKDIQFSSVQSLSHV